MNGQYEALSNEIRALLKTKGAGIVGFADLRCLSKEARQNFDYGILIGLTYTKEAMVNNKNGQPKQYHAEFNALNERLPQLAVLTADFLIGKGYKALAKTPSAVVQDEDFRTVLPHKTVATLSGVGWIGKCATLVTHEAGSGLRLAVVLTDAPVACGVPVTHSSCPETCTICADVCPGKAPKGVMWQAGMDRDEIYDVRACSDAARARAKETLQHDGTVCGLCITHCPFTRKAFGY